MKGVKSRLKGSILKVSAFEYAIAQVGLCGTLNVVNQSNLPVAVWSMLADTDPSVVPSYWIAG